MTGQVIIMRPDEFRDLIAELKQHITQEIKASIKPVEVEQSVTPKEMAAHLKITTRTLWRRFEEGKYPASLIHRDAGRPKFYKSEFEKFLKTGKV